MKQLKAHRASHAAWNFYQEPETMMNIAAESHATVPNATQTVVAVYERLLSHCLSITRSGDAIVALFEPGRAILQPCCDQIWIRVETDDSLQYHGIKTLLIGCLKQAESAFPDHTLWIPADVEHFKAIRAHLGTPRT
jgi:hypothetical protein